MGHSHERTTRELEAQRAGQHTTPRQGSKVGRRRTRSGDGETRAAARGRRAHLGPARCRQIRGTIAAGVRPAGSWCNARQVWDLLAAGAMRAKTATTGGPMQETMRGGNMRRPSWAGSVPAHRKHFRHKRAIRNHQASCCEERLASYLPPPAPPAATPAAGRIGCASRGQDRGAGGGEHTVVGALCRPSKPAANGKP